MKRISPPKHPPPDDFDLAYLVHCLAYIEQEDRLWKERVRRAMRVGAIAIMCVVVALLCACQGNSGRVCTPPQSWKCAPIEWSTF